MNENETSIKRIKETRGRLAGTTHSMLTIITVEKERERESE